MSKDHPFRIGFLIHDVSRLRRTHMDRIMKPLGLTRSQYWVIVNLTRHGGNGMVQTDLAKVMTVGKVTLGRLIDCLEESGYVERKADPIDRRAKRIHLSKKGKKVVKDIQQIAEKANANILHGISEEEIEYTEEVLARMKKRLLEVES